MYPSRPACTLHRRTLLPALPSRVCTSAPNSTASDIYRHERNRSRTGWPVRQPGALPALSVSLAHGAQVSIPLVDCPCTIEGLHRTIFECGQTVNPRRSSFSTTTICKQRDTRSKSCMCAGHPVLCKANMKIVSGHCGLWRATMQRRKCERHKNRAEETASRASIAARVFVFAWEA